MVKNRYVLIGVLIGIIGIVVAIALFPSEEKRIRKPFNLLTQRASKFPDENTFTVLRKMKEIGALFDEHCELKASDPSLSGVYSREEISAYAASVRSSFSQLNLEFYDFHIGFPEKGLAKVALTTRLTGKSMSGEQVDETRELECTLKKIEKKWLFSQIEIVEVLIK
jgi:sensor histidine kinase YesM